MKPWLFLILWVVFWVGCAWINDKFINKSKLGPFGYPEPTFSTRMFLSMAIIGGGGVLIFALLDGFIRYFIG